MSIFVTRLNQLRGDNSVSAFARLADIPQPSMDKYLKGRLPSIEILIRLSTRFGVSADWLLGISDDRSPCLPVASDSLRRRVHDLEVENEALQKALAIVGGHRAHPAKTGGASATKTA